MPRRPHWTLCPHCGRERPKAVIVGGVCDYDRVEAEREAAGEAFEARQADTSWRGPEADAIRLERNRLLNLWEWTVRPGSPLSTDCQISFTNYFKKLHRITVDFANPSDVKWPSVPALQYAET